MVSRPSKTSKAATAESPPPKNKGGRPHKLSPTRPLLKQLATLGGIQCTHEEAAAVLGVAKQTFQDFLDREPAARDAFENGKKNGIASVRRNLFHLSRTNVAAGIWLSKQYLGMREPKSEHEHTGPRGGPIQHIDLSKLSDEQLAAYTAALAVLAAASGDPVEAGPGGDSEEGTGTGGGAP